MRAPSGLSSPFRELIRRGSDFNWVEALLALTFSQPEENGELHATPHYCLRSLGLIDQHSRRGGRQYQQFADAIERLSLVRYRNDAFYDPVRTEHRRVKLWIPELQPAPGPGIEQGLADCLGSDFL